MPMRWPRPSGTSVSRRGRRGDSWRSIARAAQRVRRRAVDRDALDGAERRAAVDRQAEAVEHAAEQRRSRRGW